MLEHNNDLPNVTHQKWVFSVENFSHSIYVVWWLQHAPLCSKINNIAHHLLSQLYYMRYTFENYNNITAMTIRIATANHHNYSHLISQHPHFVEMLSLSFAIALCFCSILSLFSSPPPPCSLTPFLYLRFSLLFPQFLNSTDPLLYINSINIVYVFAFPLKALLNLIFPVNNQFSFCRWNICIVLAFHI